jgi:hypothetical protein
MLGTQFILALERAYLSDNIAIERVPFSMPLPRALSLLKIIHFVPLVRYSSLSSYVLLIESNLLFIDPEENKHLYICIFLPISVLYVE